MSASLHSADTYGDRAEIVYGQHLVRSPYFVYRTYWLGYDFIAVLAKYSVTICSHCTFIAFAFYFKDLSFKLAAPVRLHTRGIIKALLYCLHLTNS